MSFSDAAAKFKKHAAEQEAEQPSSIEVDPQEVETLRAHMLGVLIRDAREASGYSIEELAATMSLDANLIMNWEYGRIAPSLPQLEVLAYLLQVPISHFWGNETLLHQKIQRQIDRQEYEKLRDHMIGLLVRQQREEQNMTQETLAQQLNISVTQLAAYEMGDSAIPMTLLVPLSSALHVNLDYFLPDSGRIGQFITMHQLIKVIEALPPDVREFVSVPANQAYIRVAMNLADIPTDSLRTLAEGLLDITF